MNLTVLALALLPLVPIHLDDEKVDQARDLFRQPEEAKARQASDILARENSVAAMEVLLANLERDDWDRQRGYLAPGHYRDVSWEGLEKITDPYARRAAEEVVKNAREDMRLRQWCIRLIGVWKEDEFGETVQRALKDKEIIIRREAARTLGLLKYSPSADALKKLARHKDYILRANSIEALARIDATEHAAIYEKGLKDKDAAVRCAVLGVALTVDRDRAEELSYAMLRDDDWRPRAQAVENLSRIRTKTAVDGLIEALEDGRPAVVDRTIDGLQDLTEQRHTRADQWQRWWKDNRETFRFPAGRRGSSSRNKEGRSATQYNGIPVTSDHIAFLIDQSEAMDKSLATTNEVKAEAAYGELDQLLTRILESKGELTFNVYNYNERFEALENKKPAKLSKKSRKAALAFVKGGNQVGLKNIWQILEHVVPNPDLDTIYLLSSGEPDLGLYVHWNRVTDYLRDMNRFHKVVVHSIAYSDNDWYRQQMEEISKATGGQFHFIE